MSDFDTIKPSHFNKAVLAALGVKSSYTQNVVYAYDDDVYNAVLAALGVTDEEFGMKGNQTRVRYCFSQALKNLERNGLCVCMSGRGNWRLTETGVEHSIRLSHLLPRESKLAFDNVIELMSKVESEPVSEPTEMVEEETPVKPPPLAIVQVQEKTQEEVDLGEGVSFDFIESQITDSYIINLLVSGTNCFGSWSNRSNTCSSCSLQAQCQQRQLVMLAELAAELERTKLVDMQARQTQIFPDTVEIDVDYPPDINIFDNLFEPVEDPPTVASGPVDNIIKAPVALICENCKNTIPRGTRCMVTIGVGAYHMGCTP